MIRIPPSGGVAIKDGKILSVGSNEDVLKSSGEMSQVIDLGNKTMIPGFFDAHSHLSQVGLQAGRTIKDDSGSIWSGATLYLGLLP
jgi:predicted amidohydrolase YtcJ